MTKWAGRRVQQARAIVATWLPAQCGQCGGAVTGDDDWVVGHKVARAIDPRLTWVLSNWQPEHRSCSDASGQAVVIERARLDGARAARAGLSSHRDDLVEPPPLPFPLSARPAPLAPFRVDEALTWPTATRDAPSWLAPYVEVPQDVAHEPTAMNPPHPEAVGSYGPELIEWARETLGITVRWWQGLSLVRILEHREDGSLCWEEVLISCSRRAGKSVVLRLLALWRLVFAPALFGEVQLVVHSANTLRVAKEPMRYASAWARRQEHLKVSTNNNNYAIEDTEGGHRWIVLPVENTAGLDTNMGVIDEAWEAKPEVVDDDLEPSLLERASPQLVLISTAHRRATSLMRNRISSALAGEDADRTLILLWAAQPTAELGALSTWRAASPHWSPERERYVTRKYAKALRGEQDPEFDDPDPLAGFRSQYTNAWLLKERATPGAQLVDEDIWRAQTALVDDGRAPSAAAIEAWSSEGVSLALAWREGDAAVVSVSDHRDLAGAVAELRRSRFRGRVTVGASLDEDPALARVRRAPKTGPTAAAAVELGRLLAAGQLLHDGGEHLAGQVLEVRTAPGANGPRLVSKGRADAVKAAAWAATSARAHRPSLGFVQPSGVGA
ncbi:HNH endonuclease [Nocardioides sp. GXZ039]|uniref:HNH endonuclease n=1 Tax=Nocardioides sp. GXZ039 TaxID=3136018 RepID=UPI0030F48A16